MTNSWFSSDLSKAGRYGSKTFSLLSHHYFVYNGAIRRFDEHGPLVILEIL